MDESVVDPTVCSDRRFNPLSEPSKILAFLNLYGFSPEAVVLYSSSLVFIRKKSASVFSTEILILPLPSIVDIKSNPGEFESLIGSPVKLYVFDRTSPLATNAYTS